MSTILNVYDLSGGDTTSSVFTYSGATRNLDIEIITDSISGGAAYVTIETSADQTNWILVPDSQIQINRGSDSYVYHITESEGDYVRAKVYRMDSRTGTVTITASQPTEVASGVESVTGDSVDNTDPANPIVNALPTTGTPYTMIQYDGAGVAQEITAALLPANNLSDVTDVPTANANLTGYKKWSAIITQSGTSAPTVVQEKSDFPTATFTLAYDIAGQYKLNNDQNLFSAGNTIVTFSCNGNVIMTAVVTNDSNINFKTELQSIFLGGIIYTPTDGFLTDILMEVRIYQ